MSTGSLENYDLAPVPPSRRTWRVGSYAALWISMSACVPTYMLASSLIAGGMNWWQAVLTIFLGNAIVLVPILLNAHAGARYRDSVPRLLSRVLHGTRGANLPALMPGAGGLRLVPGSSRGSGVTPSTGYWRPCGRRWPPIPPRCSALPCPSSPALWPFGGSICGWSTRASIRSGSS